MNEIYKDLALTDNQASGQFEMKVGDNLARIIYRREGNRVSLMHTEVDKELGGKGAGTAIIEKVLQFLEQNIQELVPYCPFVILYLKRHPEWKRILAPGVKL